MSQSEPRRCRTASSNWLRIIRNQEFLKGMTPDGDVVPAQRFGANR
jgi:hypothetical protein